MQGNQYTFCVYVLYVYCNSGSVCGSLMQLGGDLDALQSALSDGKQPESEVIGAGKCSALIKLLPGNAELYVSHDTWDVFQSMLRIYKLYDLPFFVLGETHNGNVCIPVCFINFILHVFIVETFILNFPINIAL